MSEAELEIWQPPPSLSAYASSFPSLSPTSLTSLPSFHVFYVLGFVAPFFEWIFPAGPNICLPIRQRPQARPFNIGLAFLDPHVLPKQIVDVRKSKMSLPTPSWDKYQDQFISLFEAGGSALSQLCTLPWFVPAVLSLFSLNQVILVSLSWTHILSP